MMRKKLSDLRMLAQLRQEIELGRLAALTQQCAVLREEQQVLRAALRAQQGAGVADPAAFEKYRIWVQNTCDALAQHEAGLAPELAEQRAIAAKAFGRNEALDRLMARQLRKERRQPLS